MTQFGTRRQSEETTSERNEGLTRQASQGLERNYREARYSPSVFSVSPGEFFTMSPITLMRRFTEDIDRAFGLNTGLGRGEYSNQDFVWAPPVEVRQAGNNLLIRADLPGLSENDIKLEATENGLVIHGERRREETREESGWHHSERVYGRFYRLIPLPESASVDQVKANFRNGVLEVVVPVPEMEKRNRQIPIQTSNQSIISEPGTFSEGRSRAATSGR